MKPPIVSGMCLTAVLTAGTFACAPRDSTVRLPPGTTAAEVRAVLGVPLMELSESKKDDVDHIVALVRAPHCRPEVISEMWLYRYQLSSTDIAVFLGPDHRVQCIVEAKIPDRS